MLRSKINVSFLSQSDGGLDQLLEGGSFFDHSFTAQADLTLTNPALTFRWPGATATETGFSPADSNIAAGTNTIIAVTTGGIIDIYNKTGAQKLVHETLKEFFDFERPSDANVIDARVIWDQLSSRFIVSAGEQVGSNSFFDIAVSKTSNPLSMVGINTASTSV